MMLRILGAILLAVWLAGTLPATAQTPIYCYPGSGSISQSSPCSATNPLAVSGTVSPTGTQDTNLIQILGASPSLTNPLWITPATGANFPVTLSAETTKVIGTVNQGTSPWVISGATSVTQTTSPWIVAGGGTAGTAATGVVTIQGIASMTPVQVSQATAANLNAAVVGTGTAGSAAGGVLTIQGVTSMTPVQVSQATAGNLNATVVGTGTFATQSAVTAASGAFASGSHASGSISSGAFASGAIGSGAVASGAYASGSIGSGAIASGAVSSGAFASGAFASGSFASGSQRVGITPTDRTVTSATGSSQTLMSSNASRKSLTVVNTGNANCGVNPTGGTAAIGGAGTLTLVPTGSYSPSVPTLAAVTVICTAGQPIYGDES